MISKPSHSRNRFRSRYIHRPFFRSHWPTALPVTSRLPPCASPHHVHHENRIRPTVYRLLGLSISGTFQADRNKIATPRTEYSGIWKQNSLGKYLRGCEGCIQKGRKIVCDRRRTCFEMANLFLHKCILHIRFRPPVAR